MNAGGKQISEFVGLRSKSYSFKMDEGDEEKKCKGIKKIVINNTISFQDYKNCLLTSKPQMREMNVIRSRNHEIYSETVNKIALCPKDDKRTIQEDGIHTLAFGHKIHSKSIKSLKKIRKILKKTNNKEVLYF